MHIVHSAGGRRSCATDSRPSWRAASPTPVALARTRMLAGLLGRKTGQGFYSYEGNAVPQAVPQPEARPVDVGWGQSVIIGVAGAAQEIST